MTLIDKADALAAIEAWFAETKSFAPPSLLEAIRALPARGVGVDRADNLRRAIAYAMTELAQSAQDAPAIRAEAALIRAFKADAALAPTDAAQAREAAARLLLDMLYMRNGAHEGVSKEDAQAMWDAASTREGYAAVDAFLRSIIGEARA